MSIYFSLPKFIPLWNRNNINLAHRVTIRPKWVNTQRLPSTVLTTKYESIKCWPLLSAESNLSDLNPNLWTTSAFSFTNHSPNMPMATLKIIIQGDLPGDPVVKTSPFKSRGCGFTSWSGSYDPTCFGAKKPKYKTVAIFVINSIKTLKWFPSKHFFKN